LLTPGASAEDQVEPSGYRQAIRDALSEYESERYLEALTLFARAHELYPNARTLRGLGVVNLELRRYSDSVRYLQSALASDEKPLDPELRSETEQLLMRARTFVAQLRVVVAPPTASVAVDGSEPQGLPKEPLLLSVGPHQLEFQAPGYEPSLRAYTVVGGERLSWQIRLRSGSAPSGGVTPSDSSFAVYATRLSVIGP
jgi:tetratricopeptide (TPR) repeat protein